MFSPFFRDLFTANTSDDPIELPDVKHTDFCNLLRVSFFTYSFPTP